MERALLTRQKVGDTTQVMELVSQVLAHLTLKCSFQHRFGELLQQSVDVFRRPPLLQQAVDHLVADRLFSFLSLHFRSPYCAGERLHRIQHTLYKTLAATQSSPRQ